MGIAQPYDKGKKNFKNFTGSQAHISQSLSVKLHIGFKKYLLECAYHNEHVQNEVHFDRDGVNSYVNVYK